MDVDVPIERLFSFSSLLYGEKKISLLTFYFYVYDQSKSKSKFLTSQYLLLMITKKQKITKEESIFAL